MLKILRWLTVSTLLLLLLAVPVLTALFLYALENEPLVPASSPADYMTVADGKAFVKRIKMQVEAAGAEGTTLTITERELNRLAQLGSHAFKRLAADVDIDGAAVNVRMSVRLPENPFGEYLNLGAQVRQSSAGVGIHQLSMGPLSVPGQWLLPLAARIMNILLRNTQASDLLQGARGIQIAGDAALFTVSPPPDVKDHLKQAVRTVQAYRFQPGEGERVSHYYDLLAAQGEQSGGHSHSLNVYLAPLMVEAAKRSAHNSAVAENRAAILALSIYFSNGAFEDLIGKLVSGQRELVRSPYPVTLAGRQDLMAHFLTSAAITLASQQGIGIAAGEFKELLDSGYGGSGFSFVDLAADRAGVQFVLRATASDAEARLVQEQLSANNGEASFFPDTAGLAEDLSDEQFRQQYVDVESKRYLQEVELIDQRIARALIYAKDATSKSTTY